MTPKEKIEKIHAELSHIDSSSMTTAELKIRDIIEERKSTPTEKKIAIQNSVLLGDL